MKTEATTEVKAPAAAKAGSPRDGTIVYNKFLDAWRCIDANGREVLSIGSKEAAIKAYPNFKVKE